jgi:signal transduction histidine kinase
MKALPADSVKSEEIRQMMERQVNQLVTLVNDLLDVSRITLGKVELRKHRVKLIEIIQSALEASQPFINEAKHEFEYDIPPEPIELDGDPHRLAQVISNLLNNAAKYTPDRGRIRLRAEKQGGDVVISVMDTGIGIPTEMQESIFEMFAQA